MCVAIYMSVKRLECHAKDFAGAVITQCIAFAILDSTAFSHEAAGGVRNCSDLCLRACV